MKTLQIDVYEFSELSDKAKEKARDWFSDGREWAYMDESLGSIKAFCACFGVRLTDYEISGYGHCSYSTDAENHHFRGLRLKQFNRDFMPTGYYLDCALWETFHDQFKATGSAKQAFDSAMDAGFKAWANDLEYQLSDEYIDEYIVANEYTFTIDGKRFG